MNEHLFGSGNGTVNEAARERIDAIATEHGATFVNANIPGQGPRYWFACRNRGNPFDQRTEGAVWTALREAGLADENGLVEDCFERQAAQA